MKIKLTKDVLEKLKNDLLLADMERKLGELRFISNHLFGEFSEVDIYLSGNFYIRGEKKLILEERKNCEEYLFSIDGYDIWRAKFSYEDGEVKAFETGYLFEPLSLIETIPKFLDQPRNFYIRKCYFVSPQKYILKYYYAKESNLESAFSHKTLIGISRYEGDILRTSECYDKYGILESRYYNLNGCLIKENLKPNHSIDADISRNRFKKQYKNALALTRK